MARKSRDEQLVDVAIRWINLLPKQYAEHINNPKYNVIDDFGKKDWDSIMRMLDAISIAAGSIAQYIQAVTLNEKDHATGVVAFNRARKRIYKALLYTKDPKDVEF